MRTLRNAATLMLLCLSPALQAADDPRFQLELELARLAGGWNSRLVLEDRLYGAGVDETLRVAAEHGGDCHRLMLVGHEPTWSMTVRRLTGAIAAIKTATLADIELNAPTWDTVPTSNGTLVSLLQPRHALFRSKLGCFRRGWQCLCARWGAGTARQQPDHQP